MDNDLTNTEKKFHTDLALAYLYENRMGEPMTLNEISSFTGLKLTKIEDRYYSAMNKLRKQAKLIEQDII